jgi:hypothetical protein
MHSHFNKRAAPDWAPDRAMARSDARQTPRRTFGWIYLGALFLAATAAEAGLTQARAQGTKTVLEPHTEAAVIAADDGWGKAEEAGDFTFVNALLLPEYRSISSDGSVHDKAAILASIKKRAGNPGSAASRAQWTAAHPSRTSTAITGDTAILTCTLNRPGSPSAVLSSDIFVYRDGHWRALYSQHSEAGKG